MKYFIYAPLQILCMVFCYLTNWLVVLFGTEEGQLPGFLNLWNTWDDTLDNRTDVGRMPKFLRYDWDEHYQSYTEQLYGRKAYRERLIKPFTPAEKVKRYFCRCHWLYRNCGYGFAYYLFGQECIPPFRVKEGEGWYFIHGNKVYPIFKDGCVINFHYKNPWAFKSQKPISKNYRWEVYLGWKIQRRLNAPHWAMIATRVWIKRI